MRRNSGGDDGRNLNLDPALKEQERGRGNSGTAVLERDRNKLQVGNNSNQRTTAMGSGARKPAKKG